MDKRTFLKKATVLGMGTFIASSQVQRACAAVESAGSNSPADYWDSIRAGYQLPTDFINLENGYYCIQPQEILQRYLEHIAEVNKLGAYYMRTVQFDNKKRAATKLATTLGCPEDQLIITRNTTESLDMIIAGLPWQPSDEAVMAVHDYGAMLDMFEQVAKRHGILNKKVTVPLHPQTDEEIVQVYERAITARTRLLMVCHMVNITGQILPVKKICDMAHKKGVLVMVDGAHAIAHLKFRIDELNCDFYGASLHKWLSVPLGAGMLYVAKAQIPNVWPLLAEAPKEPTDIARLNHTGTHPAATDLTIVDAIDYYTAIGAARKEERLRYLQRYWTQKVRQLPNVMMYTPEAPERSCAIATVGVKSKTPAELADYLLKKHRIYTVAIDNNGVKGCRITPNIYTTLAELDTLVVALKEA
jgi:selenocysteine lyase/cysteine desulfurase